MSRPLLLLVDDAPEIGLIVQHLGKRAGQNVVCCADAVAAWNYLRDSVREGGETPKPQLILLDVNLPGMSGVDLCAGGCGA